MPDVSVTAIVQEVSAVPGSMEKRCANLSCRRVHSVTYQKGDCNTYSMSCALAIADLSALSKTSRGSKYEAPVSLIHVTRGVDLRKFNPLLFARLS